MSVRGGFDVEGAATNVTLSGLTGTGVTDHQGTLTVSGCALVGGLSQNGMIRRLGLEEELTQSRVSGYELGTREPSLLTLLRYAKTAGVCVPTPDCVKV